MMFGHLRTYSKIVVTGPPRSGTRIASRIIAYDTGHRYVDEKEHDYGTDEAKWSELIQQHSNIVVQSPGVVMRSCINNPPPGIFLVFMRRSVADIHASEERIKRQASIGIEVTNNMQGGLLAKLSPGRTDPVTDAYRYWDDHPKIVPWLEVSFASLTGHPLWTPGKERVGFYLDQTGSGDTHRVRGAFRGY